MKDPAILMPVPERRFYNVKSVQLTGLRLQMWGLSHLKDVSEGVGKGLMTLLLPDIQPLKRRTGTVSSYSGCEEAEMPVREFIGIISPPSWHDHVLKIIKQVQTYVDGVRPHARSRQQCYS
jgi:hypothetical protein